MKKRFLTKRYYNLLEDNENPNDGDNKKPPIPNDKINDPEVVKGDGSTDTGGGGDDGGLAGGGAIQQTGLDLLSIAKKDVFDPVIGRDEELHQTIVALGRKTKNNPALIGEAGVGKTAVVEKLAQLMVSDECPVFLKDKLLYSLAPIEFVGLINSPYVGLKAMVKEMRDYNIILFIDEFHAIKMIDKIVYEQIKPVLARGEMNMIIATTNAEYQRYVEKDTALERRFQKIMVDEPSDEQCMEMLNALKARYGKFHNVTYSDEALEAFLKLSKKYITDRFLPDKAIDLMDETGSKIRIARTRNPEIKRIEEELLDLNKKLLTATKNQDFEKGVEINVEIKKKEDGLARINQNSKEETIEITKEMVESLVAKKTRIPIETITPDKKVNLKGMEVRLKSKIIGQDDAVVAVSKAIKRVKAGLKDPNRPMGVFMFCGPTGVGKTEFVKALAEEIFGAREKMFRLDMSEFSEPHTVARLFGSPPGYVGYGEGNQFTEKIRRNPHSVILLDEMEKAHPKVWQTWLQVFEDGHMTDGEGRKVNFKETLIIMTSNAGAGAWSGASRKGIGFKKDNSAQSQLDDEDVKRKVNTELKKTFAPEFLNRIDEILIFKPLEEDSIYKIVGLELQKVANKLKEKGIDLSWSQGVVQYLTNVGYDKEYGARPLRRAIQKYIETPLADAIIDDDLEGEVELDYNNYTGGLLINGNPVNESKVNKFTMFENRMFGKRSGDKRVLGFESFFLNERSGPSPLRIDPDTEEDEDYPARPYVPTRPSRPEEDPDYIPEPTRPEKPQRDPEEDPDYIPEPTRPEKPQRDPDPSPDEDPYADPDKIERPSYDPGPIAKGIVDEMDVAERYIKLAKKYKLS